MSDLRLLAIAVLLFGVGASAPAHQARGVQSDPQTSEAEQAVERGRLLVAKACASCHATGSSGTSPMPEATPFREIVHRYPLDQLEEGFAEGLVTAHPAMPEFVFRAGEIDDLIAYLETVKADR